MDLSQFLISFAAAFAVAVITGFFSFLYKNIKRYRAQKSWRKNEIKNKLIEVAESSDLKLISSRGFIPTMGQNEPPHEDERVYISPYRFPLIDRILKVLYDPKNVLTKKRYIILGGSGMGKTTFSAAFFYNYIKKSKREDENSFPVFIKSLANPNVINEISSLDCPNKSQAIIILDALDENIEASRDVSTFLGQLEAITQEYKLVIITCRTQFFENETAEPEFLKVQIVRGTSKMIVSYDKIYISPFTEKEAKKYLRNKYGFRRSQYLKALNISRKCWDTLSRPMILSFIDDLLVLDDNQDLTKVEIFNKIIDKWFEREIAVNSEIDKTVLYSFSEEIALFIYEKWIESKSTYLSDREYKNFVKEKGFEKSPYSFRSRSLLNRRRDGAIKFAHKSFWEYFLAINSFLNPGKQFKGYGFDMAKEFVNDLCSLQFTNNGILEEIHHQDILPKSSYCHIEFPDIYETLINHIQHDCKPTSNSKMEFIHEFWINSIDSLLNTKSSKIYSNSRSFSDYAIKSDAIYNEQSLPKTISGLISKKNSFDNYLIERLQNSFRVIKVDSIEPYLKQITQLYQSYIDIAQLLERNSVFVHHLPLSNIVVFPCFLNISLLISENKSIIIGCGFTQNIKEILYFIDNNIELFRNKLISVFVNVDDLDKIAQFIYKFEFIEMRTLSIVFYFIYRQRMICYFLNELNHNYELEDIEKILIKMFECSKENESI